MSRNEKAVLCFGIFLMPLSLAAQQDGEPRFVRPQETVIFKECLPETVCRSDLAGLAEDFTLRWSSRTGRHREECMTMEMEGRTFGITMTPDLVGSIPFPLRLLTFPDDLALYEIITGRGIANEYADYFTRDDDGAFHYLGHFPSFFRYYKNQGLLYGSERIVSGHGLGYYFKLEDNFLVLEKFEDSLVLQGVREDYTPSDYDTRDGTTRYGTRNESEFFDRSCR